MQAPAMIAVVRGPEHVVELVNPVYSQVVGLRDSDELVGKPLREVLPELESQEYFRRLDQAYTTGQPYIGHEMPTRINRRNGKRLEDGYFDVVLQPLRNAQGEVDGIFAYTVDVTEYGQARQRAQELDRLKEEFIETASHDLKSPLTSIRGYAQLLLRRVTAPAPDLHQIAQGLAMIDAQTAAMTHLLDDLLDASRIQAGESI